jgi:hypothetical protein
MINGAKKIKKKPRIAKLIAIWGLIHLFRGWRRQSVLSIKCKTIYRWLGVSLPKKARFVQNNLE